MLISNHEQLTLLLRCLGMGFWLQILWESDNVLFPHGNKQNWMYILKDFLLSLLCGLFCFVFSLAVNQGEWRLAMLAAIGVGAWVCHATYGRLIRTIAHRIRRLYKRIAAVWEQALQKGGSICKKMLKKLVFFYKKGLHTTPFWVYNRNNK